MSASLTPPFLAISSCWANSYSAWFSQPMRRIRSSRSRNGRVCLPQDVAGERRPALHQLGMMGEHLEDVENAAVHRVLLDAPRGPRPPWSKGRASGCAACAGSSCFLLRASVACSAMSSLIDRRRLLLAGAALGAAPRASRRSAAQESLRDHDQRDRDHRRPAMGHADRRAAPRSTPCTARCCCAFPTAADEIADLLRARPRAACRPSWRCATPATRSCPRATSAATGWAARCGPTIRRAGTCRPGRCAMPWNADSEHRADLQRQRQRQALLGALSAPAIRARSHRRPARAAGAVDVADRGAHRLHAGCCRRRSLEREAGERLRWLEQCGLPAAQGRDLRLALSRRRATPTNGRCRPAATA